MKKAIITIITSGLFMLALVFSFNKNTSEATFSEEAFASAACCPEHNSVCIYSPVNLVFMDKYFTPKGPCGDEIDNPSSVQ